MDIAWGIAARLKVALHIGKDRGDAGPGFLGPATA
jgi:hypothetical protein